MQPAKIRSEVSFPNIGKAGGLVIACIIAVLMALFSFRLGPSFGLLSVAISLGLIIALACFIDVRIGFYGIIAFGYILGGVDRIFFGKFPLVSILLLFVCFLVGILFIRVMNRPNDCSWIHWHPIVWFYLLTTAYAVVELFNPQMESFLGWLSAFWQRMASILLLMLSFYVFKDIRRVRFFFKFTIGAIFITALYGCFQQWFGLSYFDRRWVYSDPHIYGLFSLPGGGLRKFSFLTDPANFGTFMAAGAALILIFIFRGVFGKKKSLLLVFFSLITILGMSYSGTRTANIMIFAALGLYVLMTLYQRSTRVLALTGFFGFFFIMNVPIYSNVTLNRFRSAFNLSEDNSLNVRLVHRKMFQPYMHAHPFGGGINTVGAGGAKYNPGHFLAGFPPDGAYFAEALQGGWIGLFLNCAFYFLILSYCVHYFYKCKNDEIKTYYAAMTVMLFAQFLGAYAQFTVSSIPQSLVFIPFLAIISKLHTLDSTLIISKTQS